MATYTNALLVFDAGGIKKITSSDNLAIGGSMAITGNLNVTGDITSTTTTNVLVGDAFIDMSSGYTTTVERSSGFTFNVQANGTARTSVAFTAGGASAPMIEVGTNSGDFAAEDIIQVSGAANPANNGLYAIKSVGGTGNVELTLYGTGTGATAVPAYALFCQSNVTTGADTGATITKVDLAVLAVADGTDIKTSAGAAITVGKMVSAFYTAAQVTDFNGTGAGTGYTELGSATLQSAYDGGSTITLTNGSNLTVNVPGGAGTAGILLNAKGVNSNFTVDGANLTLSTTTSGTLTVQGRDAVTVDSTNAATNIGTGNYSGAVNIGTQGARTITIGSASATKIELNSKTMFNAASGSYGIGYDSVTFEGTVADYNIVYRKSNGNYEESDSTAGATAVAAEVMGVALDVASGQLHTIVGGIVPVLFAGGGANPSSSADIAKPVYLTGAVGEASLTAPSSGRVTRVGNLYSNTAVTTNVYLVVWNPQYIADL